MASQAPNSYGEGKAIAALECEVAEMLGKEAGVFVMKGIIAQLTAMRVWCDRSQVRTVVLHPQSHIDIDEGDAYERLHLLHGIRLGGHGPFTVADLEGVHERPGVVVVELPLRRAGFKLPTWEELSAISDWCRQDVPPLDGARLWECASFFEHSYAEIAALANSVYVSLYKGLAGFAGCVLAGPADFIAETKVWKKRHGGDLPTAFPYADCDRWRRPSTLPDGVAAPPRLVRPCRRARPGSGPRTSPHERLPAIYSREARGA